MSSPTYMRENYAAHREERRAYARAYYAAHRTERSEYDRAHGAARQREYAEWLGILTALHPCILCEQPGEHWHHVDPSSRRRAMGRMEGYSIQAIEDELEKCVALCNPCHTRMHKLRPPWRRRQP